MRHALIALIIAGMAAILAPQPAAEAGWRRPPPGYGRVQVVRHYGYYPRYHHVYSTDFATDRYAYRYAPRRYYPYYNSGYWRPAAVLRARKACCRPYAELPPYYQAWGYPKRVYGYRYRHHRHW